MTQNALRATAPSANMPASRPGRAWSLAGDVRWGEIDARRARGQEGLLRAVRRAAIAAAVRPVHTAELLCALSKGMQAAAACTLDLYDSLKHLHALRTYLETIDYRPAVTDAELAAARAAAAQAARAATPNETIRSMVEFVLTRQLTAHHLRRLAAQADEPVLAELLGLIAAEGLRHAQCMAGALVSWARADREVAEAVMQEVQRLRNLNERAIAGAAPEEAADDLAYHQFAREMASAIGEVSPHRASLSL